MPVQNIRAGAHTVFWHHTHLGEGFAWKVECTCDHEEVQNDLFAAMTAGSAHAKIHGWAPRPVGRTANSALIHIRRDSLSRESLCGVAHLICSTEPWSRPDCTQCLNEETPCS